MRVDVITRHANVSRKWKWRVALLKEEAKARASESSCGREETAMLRLFATPLKRAGSLQLTK